MLTMLTMVNCDEALNAISVMSLFLRLSLSGMQVGALSSIFYFSPKREEEFSFFVYA